MASRFFVLLHQIWAIVLALLLFFAVLLPPVLVFFPFPLITRLRFIRYGWILWSNGVIRFVCRCNFYYEDLRSKEAKKFPWQGLYICNHQSFLDIPTLLTQFQLPPVMKKETLYLPIFGLVAWASGGIIVDRKNKDSRKIVFEKCKQRMFSGFAVQYYPEGTRSKDGIIKNYDEIKKPLMEFAYENNFPIVACAIYGTSDVISNKGVLTPNRPVGLKINHEIFPKDFKTKEEFCRSAWTLVESSHQELKTKFISS